MLPSIARPLWRNLALVCLTAAAFSLRVSNFRQGLFGDEFSTAWVVEGRSLGRVLSIVYSDAEVTPPLSFVLSWLTVKIGGHEWLRLPSLVAGTATIPLAYLVGRRAVGRMAGLIAAAVMTLSPTLIYYSTEARGYALMIAFLLGSTLAMLAAVETGRTRWWIAYAACSCLALYCHYTAFFPLAGQGLWLLWAHPEARRPAVVANAGAALGYAPWFPGWLADNHSVTIPLINAFLPFNVHAVRTAVQVWALGYPYVDLHKVPGIEFAIAIVAGIGIAGAAALARGAYRTRHSGQSLVDRLRTIPRRVILVAVLALSAPVGEAVYSAVGNNVLGTRNLNASWPGLALTIGTIVAAAPLAAGVVSCALMLVGYGAGAQKALEARWARPNYPGAAHFIDRHAGPRDVVVDASVLPAVVPLTGLDAYLRPGRREFRLGLPSGPPPYTLRTFVPAVNPMIAAAIRDSRRARIFLLAPYSPGHRRPGDLVDVLAQQSASTAAALLTRLPPDYRVTGTRLFPGLVPLTVVVIAGPEAARSDRSLSGSLPIHARAPRTRPAASAAGAHADGTGRRAGSS